MRHPIPLLDRVSEEFASVSGSTYNLPKDWRLDVDETVDATVENRWADGPWSEEHRNRLHKAVAPRRTLLQ